MAEGDSTMKGTRSRKSTASSERASEKLAEARFLMEEETAQSADAIAYVHAVLSQIGLPRSPQKERVWTRSNGGASLRVVAGALMTQPEKWVDQPLPQGPYARLILADIATYAVRFKTRVIPMEDSIRAYMQKRLKLLVSAGAKGTYTAFKREALALSAAHLELGLACDGKIRNAGGRPIEAFDAWVVEEGGQQALWPCELVLSELFFRSLKTQAMPIDMRAYRALAHSAFAQDIYTWLAHRLPRLKAPLRLPWSTLAAQFGGYASTKKFRDEFVKRLKEVQAVYPDAKLELLRGRRGEAGGSLLIKPSPGPVPRIGAVLPASIGAPAVLGDPIPGVRAPDGFPAVHGEPEKP